MWVMAATLAFLRLRLLLSSDSPEAKAAEGRSRGAAASARQPGQVCAAADWLERQPQLGRDAFGCGTGDRRYGGGWAGDITELLRACLVVLRLPEQAGVYRPQPPHSGRSATRSHVCASCSERCRTAVR
jgi:segregation and condensation protein A